LLDNAKPNAALIQINATMSEIDDAECDFPVPWRKSLQTGNPTGKTA
jgi:hypothetical protein